MQLGINFIILIYWTGKDGRVQMMWCHLCFINHGQIAHYGDKSQDIPIPLSLQNTHEHYYVSTLYCFSIGHREMVECKWCGFTYISQIMAILHIIVEVNNLAWCSHTIMISAKHDHNPLMILVVHNVSHHLGSFPAKIPLSREQCGHARAPGPIVQTL